MHFFNASLIALLAVIASAYAIPHSRMTEADFTGCERACPDIYLPVCGYNNEEYKVFDNDCNMEIVNCIQKVRHNAVFMETLMNLCEKQTQSMLFNEEKKTDCNKICTMEHNPICGSDGHESKTYGNMCMFESANCESNYKLRVARMGECLEINPLKNNCNKICTMEHNPICGSDGHESKTYGNMCMFESANCESNYKLRVARMGECLEINPLKNDCNKICTMEHNPICGSDGHESKTYGNMCMFESANCESNYKLRVARMGECLEINPLKKNCNKACTREYNPVCGSDGHESKTYGNLCMFEVANCKSNYKLRVARMGECLEINPLKNNCNKACTMEYNPICGSDGHESRTYGNLCMFEVANCESNYKLRVARMGECLEINPFKNNCNKACTMEYNPICGSDGHESKTYGNLCMFEVANCESNYKLRVARMGECLEINPLKNNCNKACTMEYNPICGSDGHESKTYGNLCMFEVANCESNYKLGVARMGECLEINPLKNNCNKACTMEYNPICGSDGYESKTYGNLCMFEVANCESNYKLRVARMGECLEINPLKNNCNKACTMEYNPICGSDGHESKTYGNLCMFEVANCESNYKLRVARMGECLEINPLNNNCNKACTMEYNPICGSDGHESRTYGNLCMFEVANCESNYKLRVARMGECFEINPLKNNCNKACTMEYNPICGSDGYESKTYGNLCMFEVANCESNYKLRVARMGECLEINPLKNNCNKACTMEYNPICGSDGHESRTYGNLCMFEVANCESNYKLRVARMGECLEINPLKNNCNKACTMEYNPICGSDGHESRTYGNLCVFEVANCESNYKLRVARMGECLEINPLKNNCNKACTMEYNPICGSDGHESKTYGNLCMFEVANCESNYKLRVARMGECLEINPLKNNCNKACTMEYNPICGSDGHESKTYGNLCTFEVANCESNYKLRVARMGECLEINPLKNNCNKACTMEYNPICGSDGHESKTYGNLCMFEVANCESNYKLRVARMGECLEINPLKNNCNKACTMEYNPICGSDGHESRTYGNLCMFEVANCESNYKLRVARMGECLEINPLKNNCNKACTMEYNPICGSDGHESKTYGNLCTFEVANCESNYKLRVARMGECLEINPLKNNCNKACTMEYNPICGSDGHESKTYGNMCTFEVANCESNYKLRVARMGECQINEIAPVQEIKPECLRPCPATYIPICGYDGKNYHTYANTCQFDMMSCGSSSHLTVVKMGEC